MAHPSLTKTWHNDTYAAIDPKQRSELSLNGKTVVISGGGSGVGLALTKGFADAGAQRIAILGRRDAVLQEAKKEVEANGNGVSVSTHVTDVTDAESVKLAAQDVGEWDVLVSNAGYLAEMKSVVDAEVTEWFNSFEVNVKGTFNLAHSFLPKRKPGSIFLGINAASIQVPAFSANLSGYNSSKFAALKLLETIAVENTDLRVISMHPGVVESDMTVKMQAPKEIMDKPELPGHFAVWLCSQEAGFLNGKFAWCNWDVDELKAKKGEIEDTLMLTCNCIGWPYSP